MPVPVVLGVEFTQAEVDAMKAGAQVIIDTIVSKINLNLSNEERQGLSTVSNQRLPYVLRSVKEYAVDYPNLNGIGYSLADADKDLDTFGQMFEVLTKLTEATERTEELQMVAGHFAYEFTRDQYANAERYRTKNVAGAQVVYDGLKECFEVSGTTNDAPVNDGTTS
ncbi:MAG: hypothetical protein GC178_18695 [Flavobacteriales bacterium]|nr:hypothetical protein [Flavobacteriales bacterium]